MYSFWGKIMTVFSMSLMLSSAAFADVYPDITSDAQSVRTPYTLQPISSGVQLGAYPGANAGVPAYGSQAVYNVFSPYFVINPIDSNGRSMSSRSLDGTHLHFDSVAFKSSHSLLQPTTAPWSFTAPVPMFVRTYFIDNQAGYQNSLGIITTSQFPVAGHPLTNMGQTQSLVFPVARDAMPNLPGGGGTNLGRNTSTTPLLLSDMVEYTLGTGKTMEFFLMANAGLASKDALSPTLSTDVWFTDIVNNYLSNFQHFQFYQVPELGSSAFLVAVEDMGANADKNFSDLFFLVTLAATPEPQVYLIIGTLLVAAYILGRKRAAVVR